jgi:hypothetical protein
MLRRLLIPLALAAAMLLGPVSISTAQNDTAAFRDIATATDPRVRVAAALVAGSPQRNSLLLGCYGIH